jgi:hypothetical protein
VKARVDRLPSRDCQLLLTGSQHNHIIRHIS